MFDLANRSSLWLHVAFTLAFASRSMAQGSAADPVFANIPFEKWLESREPAQIRWTPRIMPATLSVHQRFRTRVVIEVDGNEVATRAGKGHLLMLTQFTDASGRTYQTHQAIGLKGVKENASAVRFVYMQDAFVIPGDYRVALGVFDSATGEHSSIRKTLHVGALRNDPLPGAWRDLPPVEFFSVGEPPDNWFLSDVSTKLSLPLESRRPVRIEVLVNRSPSEYAGSRIGRATSANLSALLPALKVLSQIEVRNGSLDVAVLDITRRSVVFEQQAVRELDWPRLKTALAEGNPNVIDVHALETRNQNAQFFVSEISRRMKASAESPRVLIVLSAPMAFAAGEDLRPIDTPKNPNCPIFYIRYSQRWRGSGSALGSPPMGRGGSPIPPMPRPQAGWADMLVRTLKPLDARVFDVETPEQFRKALGIVFTAISEM